jgi:hypothetical protein
MAAKLPSGKAIGIGKVLWDLTLGALGVFLFGAGLEGIFVPSTRASVGHFTGAILIMLWGVVLIIIPGTDLVKAIRRKSPVKANVEHSIPFSKPLIFLFVLTAIYTIGLSVLAVHAVTPPPGQSRGLWAIVFGLILTWWVYTDRVPRRFSVPFEFEYFVLIAWPIAVPYYLYRRLGGRGVLLGFGVWGLYLVPYLVSGFVYAAEQIYGSR